MEEAGLGNRARIVGILFACLCIAGVAMSWAGGLLAYRKAPSDYETCSEAALSASTKDDVEKSIADCAAKFGGRRKPGGGYSFFDFMQNRQFDIAGPNPSPDEQKHIDLEYTKYLDAQRRDAIRSDLAKQRLDREELLKDAAAQTTSSITPVGPPLDITPPALRSKGR
jgi:hypothetical protein